jgi:2-keto-3-deoxy-L-rhamnonate aldolase RhmA
MTGAKSGASVRLPDPAAPGRAFRRRIKTGPPLLGGIAQEYLRPSLVKLYRQAGFDFIFIEKEHGFFDGPAMTDFVLSARDNDMPVISKIGELNRAEIARLLEAGVVGIQLPRTESREQLLELIDYMKFPPHGTRAGAPCYGNVDYRWPEDSAAWLKKANASTLTVAHIETAAGYENAEEIITTPHLDMVYVGPYDFSIAMGHPGEYDHPKVRNAMRHILKLCLSNGVPFGTTASGPETGAEWIAEGCRFFEVVDELTLIVEGARQIVNAYRQ